MKTLPISIVPVFFCIAIGTLIFCGCEFSWPWSSSCNKSFDPAQHESLKCCSEAQDGVIEKEYEDIVYLTDEIIRVDGQGRLEDQRIEIEIEKRMDYTVTIESENGPVEVKLYDKYVACPCDAGVVMFVGNKSVNPSERRGVAEAEDPDDSNSPNLSFPIEYIDPGSNVTPSQDSAEVSPGKTVQIAIIDTGIKDDHGYYVDANVFWNPAVAISPCIKDLASVGYDFNNRTENVIDSMGHGTHVAGIVAASVIDKYAPKIMNLKISSNDRLDLFSAICAIRFAVREGADIINCSWGYYADEPSAPLFRAIQYAKNSGVIVVTAAGNDALNTEECPHWPANFSTSKDLGNVVTVASLDEDGDELADFSNYGPFVQVMAPGVDINSTFIGQLGGNDTCKELEGTSMAAPQITGRIAQLIAAGAFTDLNSLYDVLDDLSCDMGAVSEDKMMPLDGYSPCE